MLAVMLKDVQAVLPIFIDNLREWMQAFSEIIIQKIEAL